MKIRGLALSMMATAMALVSSPAAAGGDGAKVEGWKYQHSVGQIRCKTGFMGTGWIGHSATVFERSDLLLAPASFWKLGEKEKASIGDCTFILFGDKGEKAFKSKFEVVLEGGNEQHWRMSNVTNWAILKLKTPAPGWAQPVMASRSADDLLDAKVTIPIFEKYAKGAAPSEKHCQLQRVEGRGLVVSYDGCGVGPGVGGAPLMVEGPTGPVMIGMHSYHAEGEDTGVGFVMGNKLWARIDEAIAKDGVATKSE